MLELAHQGAQVMQVRAVELGWVNDVVIEVLSSFEDAPGTLIKEDPLVEQRNKVRGLAHDRNVAKVTLVAVPGPAGRRPVRSSSRSPRPGINVDMIVQNVGHGGATDLSFTVPRVELAAAKKAARAARPRARRPRADDRRVGRQGLDRRRRAPQRARATRRGCSGRSPTPGVNIEMISTSEVRITCIIAEDRRSRPRCARSTTPSSSSSPRPSTAGRRRRRLTA